MLACLISWAVSLLSTLPSILWTFETRLDPLFIFLFGNAPTVRTWEGPEDPRGEQVRWGGKEAGGYSAGHQGGLMAWFKKIYTYTFICVLFSFWFVAFLPLIQFFFPKTSTFTFFHKNKRHFWNQLQSSTQIYNICKSALIPMH